MTPCPVRLPTFQWDCHAMAGPMAGVVGHPQTQLKAEEPINAEHGADAPLLDPQKKAQSTRLHRPSHPLSQKIQKKNACDEH